MVSPKPTYTLLAFTQTNLRHHFVDRSIVVDIRSNPSPLPKVVLFCLPVFRIRVALLLGEHPRPGASDPLGGQPMRKLRFAVILPPAGRTGGRGQTPASPGFLDAHVSHVGSDMAFGFSENLERWCVSNFPLSRKKPLIRYVPQHLLPKGAGKGLAALSAGERGDLKAGGEGSLRHPTTTGLRLHQKCEISSGRAKAFHAKAQSRQARKENKGIGGGEPLRLSAFA